MAERLELIKTVDKIHLFIASLFVGCNVYEKETVEIIRCPVIDADTIEIPDWTPSE